MSETGARKALYCSCHGLLVMAKREGQKIFVTKEKHGVLHTLVIDLAEEGLVEGRTEEITYGYKELHIKPMAIDPLPHQKGETKNG